MKPFPADELIPIGGHIDGMIFEDPTTGVAINLYWSLGIEFSKMEYSGERVQPYLSCSQITLDIRDWKGLEGIELVGEYEDPMAASLSVSEDYDVLKSRIRFLERKGASFRVRYHLTIDLGGRFGNGGDPDFRFSVETWLPFTGVSIFHQLLVAKPGNRERAKQIAGRYMDLGCYSDPRIDREFGIAAFQFDPRL